MTDARSGALENRGSGNAVSFLGKVHLDRLIEISLLLEPHRVRLRLDILEPHVSEFVGVTKGRLRRR